VIGGSMEFVRQVMNSNDLDFEYSNEEYIKDNKLIKELCIRNNTQYF
jgi:hypothetical protein